jgi:hypothetical protein
MEKGAKGRVEGKFNEMNKEGTEGGKKEKKIK